MSNIPRTIHQIWISKSGQDEDPPVRYKRHTSSLRGMNPDFDYRLWLNSDVDQLISSEYPQYWDIYSKLQYPILKADIARWVVIHKHGGIYSDLDYLGLRPLSGLLEMYPDNPLIVVCEPKNVFSGLNKCMNGFIISQKGLEVTISVLDVITTRCRIRGHEKGYVDVIKTTGPAAVYDALSKWDDFLDKWVIPRKYLTPHLATQDDGLGDDGSAFVETEWEAGTQWANEFIPDMFEMPYTNYVWIILIGTIVVLALVYLLRR